MGKIRKLVLIMMSFIAITGCSKVEEVTEKIQANENRKFETYEDGYNKLLKALNTKYDKEFEFVEKFEEETLWYKHVAATVKLKDDNSCEFGASLKENGEFRDDFATCHYNNEIKHMFDSILEGLDYIESFEVIYTVTGNEDKYDTTRSYETYLKENYGFIYLDIHMNDRPTNEQMVERVRYLLPLVASENYQIMPSFKINDRYVYSTQINREKIVPEKMLDEGIILDALRRDDYNNGKFTDEE